MTNYERNRERLPSFVFGIRLGAVVAVIFRRTRLDSILGMQDYKIRIIDSGSRQPPRQLRWRVLDNRNSCLSIVRFSISLLSPTSSTFFEVRLG